MKNSLPIAMLLIVILACPACTYRMYLRTPDEPPKKIDPADLVPYVEGKPAPEPRDEEKTTPVWVPGFWAHQDNYWVWRHGHWQ